MRRIAWGCGTIAAVIVAAGAVLWVWRPWVPPVEMTAPGATGRRVSIGGWPGNYYPAPIPGRRPAILLLGGSEGGLGSSASTIARALQHYGYAVLHLSYFRAPGQPQALVRVPLEGFDAGLAWLRAQPGVDAGRIGIIGGSKGAEAALVIASRTPGLRAVVAGMPSSVVWPGFAWEATPVVGASWTAGGRDLPSLPYGRGSFSEGIISVYRRGLDGLRTHADAAIPIERSPAPVLLICGEKDSLWPSCPMGRQLAARDARVTLLHYADAGHGVFGPPLSPDDPRRNRLGALGGSAEGNNAARRDGWPKVLAFLDRALAK
ncbi:acyl-CoA thioester hydrolase/BAAT C-terminal domain-containing protein [Sphingomonas sp.]|uniref:acyl-CoA thioester hydrolase/BAAT C-terminal domain-containing protein n=1 Tax=Sphingomonas sp. TaxID=28214 RepID=UPI001D33206E|nr:acyl-CoA thioester hydrolase/BAAT C-terminal domain-containing protein [Sphingomonas sp.]MBX9797270.1 hypothetical protein [Sphingomonas sp.]